MDLPLEPVGDFVLKPGDEIIFNHLGETYSSQVYAINGDDISVRYRRKDITIKPKDVKKYISANQRIPNLIY